MSSKRITIVESGRSEVEHAASVTLVQVERETRPLVELSSRILWHLHNRTDAKRDLAELTAAIDGARSRLANLQRLISMLRAATRSPSKAEIAKAVAVLIACFPTMHNRELGPFAKTLVERLAASDVSLVQLDGGIKRVIDNAKFLTIAEVLSEVRQTRTYNSELHALLALHQTIEEGEARAAVLRSELSAHTARAHRNEEGAIDWIPGAAQPTAHRISHEDVEAEIGRQRLEDEAFELNVQKCRTRIANGESVFGMTKRAIARACELEGVSPDDVNTSEG